MAKSSSKGSDTAAPKARRSTGRLAIKGAATGRHVARTTLGTDPMSYATIASGVSARSVKGMIGAGRLTEEDVKRVVPPRTFQRRLQKDENLRLDEADAVARLVRVRDHARRAFDTAEQAELWLTAPNPSLDDHIPIEMARTDVGAREVEAVLTRFEHGVFG